MELCTNSGLSRGKFGWSFLITSTWDPVTDQFGALPFIYGTVVTSFLALLIAVPLGVGAAIFLAELAPPKISDALTFLIELLAAVPSVIYGLLGVFVLVPLLRDIRAVLETALGCTAVLQRPLLWSQPVFGGRGAGGDDRPVHHFDLAGSDPGGAGRSARSRAGAGRHALGDHLGVVVPYARKGIMGSIFLALARALGETMAVTMVIGNDPKINASLSRRVIPSRPSSPTSSPKHRSVVHQRSDRIGLGAVRPHYRDQRHGSSDDHRSRQVQGVT